MPTTLALQMSRTAQFSTLSFGSWFLYALPAFALIVALAISVHGPNRVVEQTLETVAAVQI